MSAANSLSATLSGLVVETREMSRFKEAEAVLVGDRATRAL